MSILNSSPKNNRCFSANNIFAPLDICLDLVGGAA